MGKIRKFIDFITGVVGFDPYSRHTPDAYRRDVDQMVNRVSNFDPQPQNSQPSKKQAKLTPNQKVELLNMIKDYCSGMSDLNGVDFRWHGIGPYSDLKSFRVKASIKIQPESQSDFDTELQSAKSQLSSEDFVLTKNQGLAKGAGNIEVHHKSYRPPNPPKRTSSYFDRW
jgi:hypothetical protein